MVTRNPANHSWSASTSAHRIGRGKLPGMRRSRSPSACGQSGSGGLNDFDGGSQKTYQRMIEEMDRQIGRVLQALDKNGLTENSIVIFTSDNGGERIADTWPISGKKTELLEGDQKSTRLNSSHCTIS